MSRPRALVTGASSGIGRAIAGELASRGWDLVLVSRDAAALDTLASESAHMEPLVADLSTDDGIAAVMERLESDAHPVSLLVHAAGLGTTVPFPDAPLEEEEAMLRVNVVATLRLAHAAARALERRGGGGIMLIASTAAYWSAGTYAAAKAWVLSMGLGLRARLADRGVRVLVVAPGFTRTQFHARSGTDASAVRPWMWLDAGDVAREAVDALDRDAPVLVPGRRYRALVETVRHLPPGGRAAVLRRLAPLRSAT